MTKFTDPVGELADARLLELAADLSVQLEKNTGMRPVLWLLSQQRAKASNAISQLMGINPVHADAIRTLQNEVQLYQDMIEACRALLAAGRDAYAAIEEIDRDEISNIVMSPEDRQLYGFNQEGND